MGRGHTYSQYLVRIRATVGEGRSGRGPDGDLDEPTCRTPRTHQLSPHPFLVSTPSGNSCAYAAGRKWRGHPVQPGITFPSNRPDGLSFSGSPNKANTTTSAVSPAGRQSWTVQSTRSSSTACAGRLQVGRSSFYQRNERCLQGFPMLVQAVSAPTRCPHGFLVSSSGWI